MRDYMSLACAVGIPVVGGFAGAIFTAPSIPTWYKQIRKPSWNPPNWIFGPMWTFLYVCMGVASWLVYRKGGFDRQMLPLGLYGAQLVLNLIWTPLFFGLHRVDLALVDITALLGLQIAMDLQFAKVIGWQTTAILLGPYFLWTSFAAFLNRTILKLNRKASDGTTQHPTGKYE